MIDLTGARLTHKVVCHDRPRKIRALIMAVLPNNVPFRASKWARRSRAHERHLRFLLTLSKKSSDASAQLVYFTLFFAVSRWTSNSRNCFETRRVIRRLLQELRGGRMDMIGWEHEAWASSCRKLPLIGSDSSHGSRASLIRKANGYGDSKAFFGHLRLGLMSAAHHLGVGTRAAGLSYRSELVEIDDFPCVYGHGQMVLEKKIYASLVDKALAHTCALIR